jgi:hypothetical protein
MGAFLTQFQHATLSAVGVSLAGAGVSGWLVYVYVLVSQNSAERLDLLTRFGFKKAFARRSVAIKDEYDKRLNEASEAIDIMGFGLRSLREDYRDHFADWHARAKVRILLLDPTVPSIEHSLADRRDAEERNPPGTICSDVKTFGEQVQQSFQGDDRFQVRVYTTIPTINIFRIDNELFWGPYFVDKPSRNLPTFIVARGGFLFDSIMTHFETVWNYHSRPVHQLLDDLETYQ